MNTAYHISRFKMFHDLMQHKVMHILLISTSYEAWIMEEDCRLSERIIHEYRGLNLSRPPRLTWVSSVAEAVERLEEKAFDLVITISRRVDREAYDIGEKIKAIKPNMSVVLLTHQEALPDVDTALSKNSSIDRVFFWSGHTDILLAIIKCVEDRLNVAHDTLCAGIRVILLVEDSPFYLSTLLPILYRELVIETHAVIEDGLNEEHRLLSMRARPKILTAHSYEEALDLYEQFKPYILGVISDVRFPRKNGPDSRAGLSLLRHIRQDRFDIPLLMTSAETRNKAFAAEIPAVFADKNSPLLHEEIRSFLMDYLGFGDFIFKTPEGRAVAAATDLYTLEQELEKIPASSFLLHCRGNDFSRWLFCLAEMELAARVRPLRNRDFDDVESHRRHLIRMIRERRMNRQKGVVVNIDRDRFDPDTDLLKIGKGSLGGKARGLAFMSSLLHRNAAVLESFEGVDIFVPQTVVITTDNFDAFMEMNGLGSIAAEDLPDSVVTKRFMAAEIPETLRERLTSCLKHIRYPLAVRSSSLMEDARHKAYAGLYKTYLLANDHPDFACRLEQLIDAVKMVYASTYFESPRAYSRRVGNRIEQEKMAVIIQRAVGSRFKDAYYPCVSGVAQSRNYYPFSDMTTEDGVVSIAMGFGKAVMEGEKNLRFCPRFPEVLPQFSKVEDILENAQQHFYALKMGEAACRLGMDDDATLVRRAICDAADEHPVKLLTSTYDPADHRIRDTAASTGHPVMTFAAILKYRRFPMAKILETLLSSGKEAFGCPVEIEFAVDVPADSKLNVQFAVVQIRPMGAREEMLEVGISDDERARAFCVSHQALGNTVNREMVDIVYVKPHCFDPARTADIARQIAKINAELVKAGRKYVLVGPGRWGSADHWLGIPVSWADICGVGAIVETTHPKVNAEPSQGSHFFHNITSLGINYLNVGHNPSDHMDWQWLTELRTSWETEEIVHGISRRPFSLKMDGRKGIGVINFNTGQADHERESKRRASKTRTPGELLSYAHTGGAGGNFHRQDRQPDGEPPEPCHPLFQEQTELETGVDRPAYREVRIA